MKGIIGCEFSQVVTQAFRKRGIETYSCDLLDGEINNEWHIKGDILEVLQRGNYDFGIFHPPCTRLCNSGVRWLNERNLWKEMEEAAEFFKSLLNSDIPYICVENPIPHKYAVDSIGEKYTQIIQPWQFGHTTSKATCLWLKGFPKLEPTKIIPEEERTFGIHLAPPGPERWKFRSRTFQGIAEAMAEQYGNFLNNML